MSFCLTYWAGQLGWPGPHAVPVMDGALSYRCEGSRTCQLVTGATCQWHSPRGQAQHHNHNWVAVKQSCVADQINLAADRCFIMNVGHTNSKRILKSLDSFGHNTRLGTEDFLIAKKRLKTFLTACRKNKDLLEKRS